VSKPSTKIKIASQTRGKISVNQPPKTITFSLGRQKCSNPTHNPIDEYLKHSKEMVVFACQNSISNEVRAILLLDLVSSVEWYLRRTIVECINICDIAQKNIEKKQIPIGAMQYYNKNDLPYSTFDHAALSGTGEVVKVTREILGIDVNKSSTSTMEAIANFEKICNLRHAIVHSRGRMSFLNLLETGFSVEKGPFRIIVTDVSYQDLMAICHSTVRAYNQLVFDSTLERWICAGYVEGDWSKDEERFKKLIDLFFSKEDFSSPDYKKIYSDIKSYF